MKIEVKTDSASLLLKAKRGEKRFAYAVVNGINEAAKSLQKKVVAQGSRDLNIRKPFAQRQLAVIKPFASVAKQLAFAEISVGQKERLLLPELATKEVEKREPFTPGAKRVAVPFIQGKVRSKVKGSIPRELLFKSLRLKRWPRGTKKAARPARPWETAEGQKQTIWRGRMRTYMIPSIGVFQRTGTGKGGTRPIFIFDPDVPLPQRFEFIELMEKEAPVEISEAIEKEVLKEIARGL